MTVKKQFKTYPLFIVFANKTQIIMGNMIFVLAVSNGEPVMEDLQLSKNKFNVKNKIIKNLWKCIMLYKRFKNKKTCFGNNKKNRDCNKKK